MPLRERRQHGLHVFARRAPARPEEQHGLVGVGEDGSACVPRRAWRESVLPHGNTHARPNSLATQQQSTMPTSLQPFRSPSSCKALVTAWSCTSPAAVDVAAIARGQRADLADQNGRGWADTCD
jgi:hypothetical protein